MAGLCAGPNSMQKNMKQTEGKLMCFFGICIKMKKLGKSNRFRGTEDSSRFLAFQ